jgi:hypothetical protein
MVVLFGDDETARWKLDFDAADAAIYQALAQRSADRVNDAFAPNEWADISREVHGWPAKTYLAAVLCGLVARATDELANPLALQVGGDENFHGYSATSLWQAIQNHAGGRVDLRNLKDQPFNNSPFTGKRVISRDWQNVATRSRPLLERTIDLLYSVSKMTMDEAKDALRSFLWGLPDAAGALAMVHPDDVDTPHSVNDPSRTLPGDVRVTEKTFAAGSLGLYAEAKQKPTTPEMVRHFAEEITSKSPGGVAAYGALINESVQKRSRRAQPLPAWRDVLHETGVLMTIWDNPSDMLREALMWSGLRVNEGVSRFTLLYTQYLRHVEVPETTVNEWLALAKTFGVAVTSDTEA